MTEVTRRDQARRSPWPDRLANTSQRVQATEDAQDVHRDVLPGNRLSRASIETRPFPESGLAAERS